MILSVPFRILKASMSPEDFASLVILKDSKDLELQQLVSSIVSRWKRHEITTAEKDSLEAPIYGAYTSWALSVGLYKETTVAADESAEENTLSDLISSMTSARILNIVTNITNYYRNSQGKSTLTVAQVRSRLLS